ncbi:hypothetical protein MSG28_000858 [Choristoneura fumiferana]|uniref:Uncharacterized protein n=1 Tax=Choristoneura fumiferana TaxID=7141 RepID=A0ACC0K380_CHOFU|nr:hypothetical protein MSG28_000858 [Choristoneura fumiferana]
MLRPVVLKTKYCVVRRETRLAVPRRPSRPAAARTILIAAAASGATARRPPAAPPAMRQLSKARDVITRAAHTRQPPAARFVRPCTPLPFAPRVALHSLPPVRCPRECIRCQAALQVRLGPVRPRPLGVRSTWY